MKKSRFTEEEITFALRHADSGTPVADVCRQLGIREASLDLEEEVRRGVSEPRQLRQLRDENARLKRRMADLTVDRHILQEVLKKKDLRPARRRQLALWIHEQFQMSKKRSCRLARSEAP